MLRLVGTAGLAGLIAGLVGTAVADTRARPVEQPAEWMIYPGPHGELLGVEVPVERPTPQRPIPHQGSQTSAVSAH
ncbi:hypothetical protein J2X36_004675 [Methylobacterium sp. BE186]|uniref:hypothetical protein n=1 Tax=Methylobacterium sp. BE186 TaxID=2817715 RepID=UPI002856A9D5|nr:hypothetical protein [Methylobacterium sp. BE186]MDR7039897.1 hypothetical protein [Methylobacterium sp. BE186]